jgi:hypothetical protein
LPDVCPSCGENIPPERAPLHARGLDVSRPERLKQDLVEIAMRKDGRWDPMRSRFLAPGDRKKLSRVLWGLAACFSSHSVRLRKSLREH